MAGGALGVLTLASGHVALCSGVASRIEVTSAVVGKQHAV